MNGKMPWNRDSESGRGEQSEETVGFEVAEETVMMMTRSSNKDEHEEDWYGFYEDDASFQHFMEAPESDFVEVQQ